MHKPYPISDQNDQNWYHISHQNGWKTIPFGAAHTFIAYIREHPPPPPFPRERTLSMVNSTILWPETSWSRIFRRHRQPIKEKTYTDGFKRKAPINYYWLSTRVALIDLQTPSSSSAERFLPSFKIALVVLVMPTFANQVVRRIRPAALLTRSPCEVCLNIETSAHLLALELLITKENVC